MVRTGLLLAVVVVTVGCASPDRYRCATDADCTIDGVAGTCVAAGDGTSYCSDLAARAVDECQVGPRLDADDSACVAEVCAEHPWCCAASWGPSCVMAAEVACQAACGGRVAFASDRLTNADHSMLLGPGAVDVWEFGGDPANPTAVPTGITGLWAYWRVAWADADRDGTPELLASTWDGYIGGDHQWLYRPVAGAPWQELTDLSLAGSSTDVIDAAFGDYDADGRVDLATVGDSLVTVMHGVDTGDLYAPGPALPTLPETDPLTGSVAAGDLDGDGDDDFAYLDYRNNLLRVVRSDRDAGAFALQPPLATRPVVAVVRFGDADGDRDLDVLMVDEAGVVVLENDGAGGLSEMWHYPPGDRVEDSWDHGGWIDVEGDGDLDVVVAGGPLPGLRVLENRGGGDFADTPLWQSGDGQSSPVETVEAGDVDGDGDLDLAAAGGDYPSRVWINQGDRTFAIGWEDAAARRHRSVAMTRRP